MPFRGTRYSWPKGVSGNPNGMPRRVDLTNQRIGRWVVLGRSETQRGKTLYWECRCDCGTERAVSQQHLRTGKTQSCGCLHRERVAMLRRKHGATSRERARPAEYGIWQAMKTRCNNPNAEGFRYYGARGIKVCAEWDRSFTAFLQDMGPRPSEQHSIDRINNDGDYEPANCRWATPHQQVVNRRPSWLNRERDAQGRFGRNRLPTVRTAT